MFKREKIEAAEWSEEGEKHHNSSLFIGGISTCSLQKKKSVGKRVTQRTKSDVFSVKMK